MNNTYKNYIEKLRALGVPLTEYNCPECGAEIETLRNDTSEPWNTLSFCPSCDAVHMKLTAPNGGGATGVRKDG